MGTSAIYYEIKLHPPEKWFNSINNNDKKNLKYLFNLGDLDEEKMVSNFYLGKYHMELYDILGDAKYGSNSKDRIGAMSIVGLPLKSYNEYGLFYLENTDVKEIHSYFDSNLKYENWFVDKYIGFHKFFFLSAEEKKDQIIEEAKINIFKTVPLDKPEFLEFYRMKLEKEKEKRKDIRSLFSNLEKKEDPVIMLKNCFMDYYWQFLFLHEFYGRVSQNSNWVLIHIA